MSKDLELEIFRAGDYGPKGSYGGEALDAIAQDYDPQIHDAPVTLDHQQTGPAFGWVRSLRRKGDRLLARLHSISGDLVEMIRKGAYKKRSIELYRQFPGTGRPYLRAVSFLGACPPEVKGLADPLFAEGGPVESIEFSAPSDLSDLSDSSDRSEPFADSETGSSDPAWARKCAELLAERRRSEIQSFFGELRRAGRYLPAWDAMGAEQFMERLGEAEPAIFGEAADPVSPLDWFKRFLESIPPFVPLGEAAPDAGAALLDAQLRGTLPREMAGARIGGDSLALHRKALSLRGAEPTLTYSEALRRAAGAGR